MGAARWIAGALVGLGLSACLTPQMNLERWRGHTRDDVIAHWGAPDSETSLTGGRRVVTWTSTWGLWILGGTCRESFTLTSEHRVDGWTFSDCPPVQGRR
ncbi:MAG: hypothetical protein ACE5IL_13765 [Myxococcota bacterium]